LQNAGRGSAQDQRAMGDGPIRQQRADARLGRVERVGVGDRIVQHTAVSPLTTLALTTVSSPAEWRVRPRAGVHDIGDQKQPGCRKTGAERRAAGGVHRENADLARADLAHRQQGTGGVELDAGRLGALSAERIGCPGDVAESAVGRHREILDVRREAVCGAADVPHVEHAVAERRCIRL
jgi:hypothetical protein